jgi:hypothetical protein
MSQKLHNILISIGAAAALASTPVLVGAQSGGTQSELARQPRSRRASTTDAGETFDGAGGRFGYAFKSRADSLAWARSRRVAGNATGFRLVVSLQDRHLWAIIDEDTVLSAPVAVAKGTTLEYGNQEWKFETPRGVRTVLGKEADPVWQPPEWLYAETALENGLRVGHLYAGHPVRLADGRTLLIRDNTAGLIMHDGSFAALPVDEHIVFGDTLYVPPMGSANRKVVGELGKYRLLLGDGYLLHGTPDKQSIGMAATHGCVRLRDEDIEWLYEHVPVGTKVYIY